jgi:hypothetical protein
LGGDFVSKNLFYWHVKCHFSKGFFGRKVHVNDFNQRLRIFWKEPFFKIVPSTKCGANDQESFTYYDLFALNKAGKYYLSRFSATRRGANDQESFAYCDLFALNKTGKYYLSRFSA